MTAQTKNRLIILALLVLGVFMTMSALTIVGIIGRASADTGQPEAPLDLFAQLYSFIRDGAHLPAVGAALMLFVWILRWGHTKLPDPIGTWFSTPIGGYVLGFGTAMNVYIGTALMADQPITFGLITQGLGVGFAASGAWEGLRDLLTKLKKPAVAITTASVVLLSTMASSGCKPNAPIGPVIGSAVVDCLGDGRDKVDALLGEFKPLLTEAKMDWSTVYQRAKQAGKSIGGCFLGELVNWYLGGVRLATGEPPTVDATWQARAALELYRKEELNGATLKTASGNL